MDPLVKQMNKANFQYGLCVGLLIGALLGVLVLTAIAIYFTI